MGGPHPISEGQIFTGSLFSEPTRVETVRSGGPDTWIVGLAGTQTERFRSVTLSLSDLKTLHNDPETEAIAMRVAMEYERAQGRVVTDVHEKDLGYDFTSLDTQSGELRLIEVKGIGAASGTVMLTSNEKRVAEDRRDCYWLYVVTECKTVPRLQEPIKDPRRFPWHEVKKVDHYYLSVDAMKGPMKVSEGESPPYREGSV